MLGLIRRDGCKNALLLFAFPLLRVISKHTLICSGEGKVTLVSYNNLLWPCRESGCFLLISYLFRNRVEEIVC